jgi:hypothetical protein
MPKLDWDSVKTKEKSLEVKHARYKELVEKEEIPTLYRLFCKYQLTYLVGAVVIYSNIYTGKFIREGYWFRLWDALWCPPPP